MQYELEAIITGFNQVANFRKSIEPDCFSNNERSTGSQAPIKTSLLMNLYQMPKREKILT